MKIIKIKGLDFKVDDKDFDRLSAFSWQVRRSAKKRYAVRSFHCKVIGMAYDVLGVEKVQGIHCDHINGDSTDNRRQNLRLCTAGQNQHNQAPRVHPAKTSKYKGVYFFKQTGRWMARIRDKGKLHYIGYFDTQEQAAKAYDAQAVRRFGEFARPNFEASSL